MSEILLSTAYLAPVSWYALYWQAQEVQLEQWEHYHKQTWRNRCCIAAANGPACLSIPVVKHNDQPIRDVRIEYRTDWRRQHWVALESAYGTTPFFEYYQDDLRPLFEGRPIEFLFDWNLALHLVVCRLLDVFPGVELTKDFRRPAESPVLHTGQEAPGDSEVQDLRNLISPKCPLETLCAVTGYRPVPYTQVFEGRYGFQPEMSIVDLLFNKGPESLLVLRDSWQAKLTPSAQPASSTPISKLQSQNSKL